MVYVYRVRVRLLGVEPSHFALLVYNLDFTEAEGEGFRVES